MNEAIPALTSRFLFLLDEDEEDLHGLKPGANTRNLLEESKEPDELPTAVYPSFESYYNHPSSSPLWSSLPRFDTIPAHDDSGGLPNFPSSPLPNQPGTPLSTKAVSLYASFSSSLHSREGGSMWQYDDKACRHRFSPLTTDAVILEESKNSLEKAWNSPNANRSSSDIPQAVSTPKVAPMVPSLLPVEVTNESNNLLPPPVPHLSSIHHDRIPSIIHCRITNQDFGGSSTSSLHFDFDDDDEVSLLADDPDEDDCAVLPPGTYHVVLNILNELDRDNDSDVAAIKSTS